MKYALGNDCAAEFLQFLFYFFIFYFYFYFLFFLGVGARVGVGVVGGYIKFLITYLPMVDTSACKYLLFMRDIKCDIIAISNEFGMIWEASHAILSVRCMQLIEYMYQERCRLYCIDDIVDICSTEPYHTTATVFQVRPSSSMDGPVPPPVRPSVCHFFDNISATISS